MLSALILSLLTAHSAASCNLSRQLTQQIVSEANLHFSRQQRAIVDATYDRLDPDFIQQLSLGHQVPVYMYKLTIEDHNSDIIDLSNCDLILLIGPKGRVPPIGRRRPLFGRTLVILQSPEMAVVQKVISKIMRKRRLVHAVVLALDGDRVYVYSGQPFQGGGDIRAHGYWTEEESSKSIPLFFEVPHNLNGRVIKATTTVNAPFVAEGLAGGSEIQILRVLSESFNFTIEFVDVNENEIFWNSFTPFGAEQEGSFRLLTSLEVDIAFSGLTVRSDRYETAQPLYPHDFEYISWIAAVPPFLTPVQKTLRVFKPVLWVIVILTIFTVSLAVSLVGTPGSYGNSVIYTLAIFCNGMPPVKTTNWALRFVTISAVITALHVFVAYQSILIMILPTDIQGRPYARVSELAEDGLTCYILSTWTGVLKNSDGSNGFDYRACLIIPLPVPFEWIAYNSSYLLFPKSGAQHLIDKEDEIIRSQLYFLEEPYVRTPICFYMAPGHILAQPFSRKIQQMMEAGILNHWRKRMAEDLAKAKREPKWEPLDMEAMFGPLVIHVTLLLGCFLVFLAELVVDYSKARPILPFVQ